MISIPYNLEQRTAFKLTYQLKKIDLSGLEVSDYVRYFLRQATASSFISDVTLEIIQGLLFASQDKFPAGATCWQKQVQLSTQDYIESYPTQNLSHVNELACDFFHEPAFKSTDQVLSRVFK